MEKKLETFMSVVPDTSGNISIICSFDEYSMNTFACVKYGCSILARPTAWLYFQIQCLEEPLLNFMGSEGKIARFAPFRGLFLPLLGKNRLEYLRVNARTAQSSILRCKMREKTLFTSIPLPKKTPGEGSTKQSANWIIFTLRTFSLAREVKNSAEIFAMI